MAPFPQVPSHGRPVAISSELTVQVDERQMVRDARQLEKCPVI